MPLLSSHPFGTSTWERGSLKQSKILEVHLCQNTPEAGDKGEKMHVLVTYTKWVNKQKYFSANKLAAHILSLDLKCENCEME